MNTQINFSDIEVVELSNTDLVGINGGYDWDNFAGDLGFAIGTVFGAGLCAGMIVTKAVISGVAGKTILK